MISIIRKVFNPKTWNVTKNTMFGGFRPIASLFKGRVQGTWKSIKIFVGKNSNFFSAVAAGSATFLVTKAVSLLVDNANDVNERKSKKYGSTNPQVYAVAESRDHMRKLSNLSNRLAYMDPDSSEYRDTLSIVIAVYNDMLVSLPQDQAGFASIANSFYGSMYRLGVQPDMDADDSKIISMFALAKDNSLDFSEIKNDIENLVLVDAYSVPLKSA